MQLSLASPVCLVKVQSANLGKAHSHGIDQGDIVAAAIAASHALVRFRGLKHGGCNVAACALATVTACAASGGAVVLGSAPECVADAAETVRVTLMRALLDTRKFGTPKAASGTGEGTDPSADRGMATDPVIFGDDTLGLVGASPAAVLAASGPWLGSHLARDGADMLLQSLRCLCFVEAENRSLPSMDAWAAQVRDDASIALCAALALSQVDDASPSEAAHSAGTADTAGSGSLRKRCSASAKGLATQSAAARRSSQSPVLVATSSWADPVRAACRAARTELEESAAVLGILAGAPALASPAALRDHLESVPPRTGGRSDGGASARFTGVSVRDLRLPVVSSSLPVVPALLPPAVTGGAARGIAARWVLGRAAYRLNALTATVVATAVLFCLSGTAAAFDVYVLGSASLARRAAAAGCAILLPPPLEAVCGGLGMGVFTLWILLLAAGLAAGVSLLAGGRLAGLLSAVPLDAHHSAAVAALEAKLATRPTRLLPARAEVATPARPPARRMVIPAYAAEPEPVDAEAPMFAAPAAAVGGESEAAGVGATVAEAGAATRSSVASAKGGGSDQDGDGAGGVRVAGAGVATLPAVPEETDAAAAGAEGSSADFAAATGAERSDADAAAIGAAAASLPVPLPTELLPFLRETLGAMEAGGLGEREEAKRLRDSIAWVEDRLPEAAALEE